MDDKQLNEIEERANAATPGPWESMDDGDRVIAWKVGPGGFDDDFDYVIDEPMDNAANAAFIAHAREDVPALLDEVKRLRNGLALANATIARVGSLIPAEPMPERGLPNEIAHNQGWYGAFELVADALKAGEGR